MGTRADVANEIPNKISIWNCGRLLCCSRCTLSHVNVYGRKEENGPMSDVVERMFLDFSVVRENALKQFGLVNLK